MAIIIDNDQRLFTLHTHSTTYQMKADQWGPVDKVSFLKSVLL